jgi:uncharacterized protein (DUF433 family)
MNTEELKGIIQSNPEIMGGTPVRVGTRVPLQNLIDYLEADESVEDFMEAFPTLKRGQAIVANAPQTQPDWRRVNHSLRASWKY